ncbi:hypothetical protein HG537_0H02590 [Torulaspora globosa]|uniref:Uncharacterized protein n=1 Tax=Torulaspora globosa TaxID=48254 RepID=A0A7H9HZY6_9SACH|nr:hypothetical protein HG537_0H02590 [Torulaspora sp. CBS 2947]
MGSLAKEPDFIGLFKEHDINVVIKRRSVRFEESSESIGAKSKDERFKLKESLQYSHQREGRFSAEVISSIGKRTSSPISPIMKEDEDESEVDNSSSDKGKEGSPCNSNNLRPALTSESGSNLWNNKTRPFRYNDCSPWMFPLPPDLPPNAFKNFHVHQSKREVVKEKFKEHVGRPIQKYFAGNSDSLGFNTVNSFDQFQGAPWDEMTSRKFIKFKFKKFRCNCRYYKPIAKRFFNDIHETSHRTNHN